MPEYLYRDARGHERWVVHGMKDSPAVRCRCRAKMRKAPLAPMVNWNGNRAVGEMHPNIRRLIEEAPERRDEFAKEHEEHEQRTAQEP